MKGSKAMKKNKKWIIIGASAAAALILVIGIILFMVFRNKYLEKLSYDDVGDTMYEHTAIVAKDGLWYLEIGGDLSEKGYTYLKSINDFYTSDELSHLSSRQIFPYYLARTEDFGNYLLLDTSGREFRIEGDNFSLSEVALPYLIFVNNTNSRMAALSLLSLQSELSTRSDTEIAFSQTFPSLSAHKFDEDSETYDYLFAKSNNEEKPHSIFSSTGARLLSGSEISPRILEKENGDPVFYFTDESTHALYTAKGEKLSEKADAPVIAKNRQWGYQLCESSATASTAEEQYLLIFTADHSFTLSDTDYDLSTLHALDGCLWLRRLHDDSYTVVTPKTKNTVQYLTLREEDGFLAVTLPNTSDQIYLDTHGRELMRSPYDDMKRHELSYGDCTLLSSARCNAESAKTVSFFFTSHDREAVRLDLPTHSTLSAAPNLWGEDTESEPLYLIGETDQDGTPLTRLYAPFAVSPRSEAYHTLDFYSHGGIFWAIGTSYTRERYDILDPVNNRVSLTIEAKSGDLARLTFEFCDTDALLADATDEDSSVPMLLLKLSRYDENQPKAVAARYFALYRTAPAESKTFQNTTLQAKELGQNLLLSHPYRFFGAENCLAVYSLSGTRIFRLDASCSLTEYASTPYHVSDILTDASDPLRYFLKIIPFSDGSDLLMESDTYGLADLQGNLILSPYYEDITAADGDCFVVTLRNAQGVISYRKGKQKTLVDFRYSYITPLGEGAFAALRRDGVCELFEGNDRIGKGELQSITSVRHARTDDDGYPIYSDVLLFNLDGTLYRHTPKEAYPPLCTWVTVPDSLSDALTDRRAKLVGYYDALGSLERTELLLPTVSDQKEFTESHTEIWYASSLAQKQTEPVTAEEILESSEFFFHLYPSVSASEETE
jgi:hypothetical protein